MILIVEGSNRVGKSTLITHINSYVDNCVIFNSRYVKNKEGRTTQEEMSSYIDGFTNALVEMNQKFPNTLLILDRYHLSELVYGQIYRDYNNTHMFDIDNILKEQNAKLLFLHSKYSHIADEEKKKEYKNLQSYFTLYINFSFLDKEKISFDEIIEDHEEVSKLIINTLKWVMKGEK